MRAFLVPAALCVGLLVACGSTATEDDTDGGTSTSQGADGGGGAAPGKDGGTSSSNDGGSSGNDAGTGSGNATDLGAGMPQVVLTSKTGVVLTNPKIVAVTYDNDTNRADIEDFLPAFAKSEAWADTTKEYGVGALTVGAPVHVSGNAPGATTDAAMQTMLKSQGITFDPQTVYMMFLPPGSIVDDGSGSKCCSAYDGYHGDFTSGGTDVVYAIMCNCPGFDGPKVTNLQQLTVVASHEAIEAVTDPHGQTSAALAYAQTDDAHLAWAAATGGETGDMCAYADTSYWIPKDMKYMVQRTWSNAAAAAGHDPCVGDPTEPYYNAIPELTDTITLKDYGTSSVKAIKIAVGATATLKLKVYADSDDAGEFKVAIQDFASQSNKYLTAKNPTGTYKTGDEVSIDITANAEGPLGAGPSPVTRAAIFQVTVSPASGTGPSTYYYGLVAQ